MERQRVPRGEPLHVRGVGRRSGAQPVVEVEDLEPDPEQAPQPHERLEETDRVRAARDADEHAVARLEHVVLADRGRDPLEDAGDGRGAAHRAGYSTTRATHAAGSEISARLGRLSGRAHTRLNES